VSCGEEDSDGDNIGCGSLTRPESLLMLRSASLAPGAARFEGVVPVACDTVSLISIVRRWSAQGLYVKEYVCVSVGENGGMRVE
jgi:hypothetical protein